MYIIKKYLLRVCCSCMYLLLYVYVCRPLPLCTSAVCSSRSNGIIDNVISNQLISDYYLQLINNQSTIERTSSVALYSTFNNPLFFSLDLGSKQCLLGHICLEHICLHRVLHQNTLGHVRMEI